jgi:hypothetical protein
MHTFMMRGERNNRSPLLLSAERIRLQGSQRRASQPSQPSQVSSFSDIGSFALPWSKDMTDSSTPCVLSTLCATEKFNCDEDFEGLGRRRLAQRFLTTLRMSTCIQASFIKVLSFQAQGGKSRRGTTETPPVNPSHEH